MNHTLVTFCARVSPLAISLLIQSTVVLVISLLAVWLLRAGGPAQRAFILRVALAAVTLGFLLTLGLSDRAQPDWTANLPVSSLSAFPQSLYRLSWLELAESGSGDAVSPQIVHSAPSPHPQTVPTAPAPLDAHQSAHAAPPAPKRSLLAASFYFYYALALLWMLGVLFSLVWLVRCQARLILLRRQSVPVKDGPIMGRLHALAGEQNLHTPFLLINPSIVSPFLAGFWCSSIFLPQAYESGVDETALTVIFAHELAHLRRRDIRWVWLFRFLTALLWFQPLLWMLGRLLEQSSEEACDLLALSPSCPAQRYADCLLRLAEKSAPSASEHVFGAGVVPMKSAVGRRIQNILNRRTLPMKKISPLLSTLIVTGAATTAVAGAALFTVYASISLPKPNFSNLPAYMAALERCNTPEAIKIKTEIQNGPVALAFERRAAEAAGIPWKLSQLQHPLPPASQNAAPIYEELLTLRKTDPIVFPEYADPLSSEYSYTPQQLSDIQKIIARHPNRFALMEAAAQKPQCVFVKNWLLGPKVRVPEVAVFRSDAIDLTTKCFLLNSEGHPSSAIKTQALGFAIAKQADSQPLLIGYPVAIAIESDTLHGMQSLMYADGPNAQVDSLIQRTILNDSPKLALRNSLASQLPMSLANITPLKTHLLIKSALESSEWPIPTPLLTGREIPFMTDMVDAAEAEYMKDQILKIDMADHPGPARHALFQYVQPVDTLLQVLPHERNPIHALLEEATVDISGIILLRKKDLQAEERATMAGAAILAIKANTGSFPDTLPAGFVDPFGRKPLGYRREGADGFVVYSIGPSGQFDGGAPGADQSTSHTLGNINIFFRYPGPYSKPVPANML